MDRKNTVLLKEVIMTEECSSSQDSKRNKQEENDYYNTSDLKNDKALHKTDLKRSGTVFKSSDEIKINEKFSN